jgi:hypothetical protein
MSHELIAFDYKGEIQQAEEAGTEATRPEAIPGDAALKIAAEERIELTEEDVGSSIPNSTTCISTPAHAVQNLRLRKVTDKHILSMLIVVYFLQPWTRRVLSVTLPAQWQHFYFYGFLFFFKVFFLLLFLLCRLPLTFHRRRVRQLTRPLNRPEARRNAVRPPLNRTLGSTARMATRFVLFPRPRQTENPHDSTRLLLGCHRDGLRRSFFLVYSDASPRVFGSL